MSVCLRMHMLHGLEQDPGYIASEPLWIAKTQDKTYLQGIFGIPRQKRLVDFTEKRAPKNHRELIERIAQHTKNNKVAKERVKSLRDSLLPT